MLFGKKKAPANLHEKIVKADSFPELVYKLATMSMKGWYMKQGDKHYRKDGKCCAKMYKVIR